MAIYVGIIAFFGYWIVICFGVLRSILPGLHMTPWPEGHVSSSWWESAFWDALSSHFSLWTSSILATVALEIGVLAAVYIALLPMTLRDGRRLSSSSESIVIDEFD